MALLELGACPHSSTDLGHAPVSTPTMLPTAASCWARCPPQAPATLKARGSPRAPSPHWQSTGVEGRRRNGRGKAEWVLSGSRRCRYRRGQELIHRRQAGDRVREQIAADQGGPGVKQTISRVCREETQK